MRIIVFILGVLLLLPGLCGAVFTYAGLVDGPDGLLLAIALPSLAVGIGGIFIIRHAWKGWK